MASPPNFSITPGTPSGRTDFFLLIAANHFLSMLMLKVNGLPESAVRISVILRPELNTDAK
jgi:hypothetical protein